MLKSKKIPLIYLLLYQRFLKKFPHRITCTAKELIHVNNEWMKTFPNKYKYPILKEMVEYGLLKKNGYNEFEILRSDSEGKIKQIDSFFGWDAWLTPKVYKGELHNYSMKKITIMWIPRVKKEDKQIILEKSKKNHIENKHNGRFKNV